MICLLQDRISSKEVKKEEKISFCQKLAIIHRVIEKKLQKFEKQTQRRPISPFGVFPGKELPTILLTLLELCRSRSNENFD
jgi:hypothetical protein